MWKCCAVMLTIVGLSLFATPNAEKTSASPTQNSNSKPFALNDGDVIAILGNGLADHMQHHGFLEAAIQDSFQGKNIVIRNLGFSGDHVKKGERNRGSWSREKYLQHVKADVIFVFFAQYC